MSEWALVGLFPFKFLSIGLFGLTYIIGGRTQKWIRRWIGGTVLILCCLALSWYAGTLSWKSSSLLLIYMGLILGYGGDDLLEKFVRRAIYGMVLGLVALAISYAYDCVLIGIYQMLISVLTSVFLGLLNPDSAVDEESIIGTVCVFTIPFMVA